MKNGNITEFLDYLDYGQELLFEYKDKKYFVQGWTTGDLSYMELNLCCNDIEGIEERLWEYSATTMKKCAEAFLKLAIFDGKTFMEIENDTTWSDW